VSSVVEHQLQPPTADEYAPDLGKQWWLLLEEEGEGEGEGVGERVVIVDQCSDAAISECSPAGRVSLRYHQS